MQTIETRQVQFRVGGEIACFTRPELKVERVSYEVMTPSAARGILEQVLWKPEMYWEIRSIAVLNPIRTIEFRRNEVKKKARVGQHDFYIEDERTQRNTVALRDVDYIVTAVMGLSQPAQPRASLDKYEEMFERRLRMGQHIAQPYLGCREFPAWVEPVPSSYRTFDERRSRDLGYMHYDFDYSYETPLPLIFKARLDQGVLHIPTRASVLEFNDCSQGGQ
jgi:CRISPR-associated protein Cas5d